MSEDYRVDPQTGAVSIRRTPEERRRKAFLSDSETLMRRVRNLEKLFFDTKTALMGRIEKLETELRNLKNED